MLKTISKIAAVLALSSAGYASAFTISMVADNDFAIFGGTSTSINNLLYQNNVDWYTQVPQLSTLSFNLASTDTTFYVLAMGGGGPEENISGKVNGVNITTIPVSESSNVASFLSGYNLSAVAGGTYNANLVDVQTAFAQATWSAPTLNTNQTVIAAAGFGSGYSFASGTAHLYRFDAFSVGVETKVPESSGVVLFGLGLLGLVAARRRKTA
jgi:hypothetical protein